MNKTAKQISKMSGYTIGERLNCLCEFRRRLSDYSHVFEFNEKLALMIDEEIHLLNAELDKREDSEE